MRLFLDTTVLLSALTGRKRAARKLLDGSHQLFTSEYAVKEVRRVLAGHFGLPQHSIELAVDEIRSRARVLPTPGINEFQKIILSDKSDAPLVCGAMKANCVFVTDDSKTLAEARKYVKTAESEEIMQT